MAADKAGTRPKVELLANVCVVSSKLMESELERLKRPQSGQEVRQAHRFELSLKSAPRRPPTR